MSVRIKIQHSSKFFYGFMDRCDERADSASQNVEYWRTLKIHLLTILKASVQRNKIIQNGFSGSYIRYFHIEYPCTLVHELIVSVRKTCNMILNFIC